MTAGQPEETSPVPGDTPATAPELDTEVGTRPELASGTAGGQGDSPGPADLDLYVPPAGYPAFSILIPSSWIISETAADEGQLIEFTTADGRSMLQLFMLQLGVPETELRVRANQLASSWGEASERDRLYPWSIAEWEIVGGGGDRLVTGAAIAASHGDLRYTVLLLSEPASEFFTEADRALASWVWLEEPPAATVRTVRAMVGELPPDGGGIFLTATVDGVATIEYDDATTFVFEDGTSASPDDLRVGVTIEATGLVLAEATLQSSQVVVVRDESI